MVAPKESKPASTIIGTFEVDIDDESGNYSVTLEKPQRKVVFRKAVMRDWSAMEQFGLKNPHKGDIQKMAFMFNRLCLEYGSHDGLAVDTVLDFCAEDFTKLTKIVTHMRPDVDGASEE